MYRLHNSTISNFKQRVLGVFACNKKAPWHPTREHYYILIINNVYTIEYYILSLHVTPNSYYL